VLALGEAGSFQLLLSELSKRMQAAAELCSIGSARSSGKFLLQQACSSLLIRRSSGVSGGMSRSTCVVQGTIATSMAIMKTQSWIQAQRDPHHKLGVNWERSNSSGSQSASD
jgi:hypothetical protein